MQGDKRKSTPDFFGNGIDDDPVSAALGGDSDKGEKTNRRKSEKKKVTKDEKKKAGFYLTIGTLDMFDKAFYKLKTKRIKIDKSKFVEYLILRGLDDLNQGDLEDFLNSSKE